MNSKQLFDQEVDLCGDGRMNPEERRAAYSYFLRGMHVNRLATAQKVAAAESRGIAKGRIEGLRQAIDAVDVKLSSPLKYGDARALLLAREFMFALSAAAPQPVVADSLPNNALKLALTVSNWIKGRFPEQFIPASVVNAAEELAEIAAAPGGYPAKERQMVNIRVLERVQAAAREYDKWPESLKNAFRLSMVVDRIPPTLEEGLALLGEIDRTSVGERTPEDCPHDQVKCLCCGKEGTPAALLAGRTSEAKKAAAKKNGEKGGRPRKKPEPGE